MGDVTETNMSRNRKNTQSVPEGDDANTTTTTVLNSGFFVPVHPVLGIVICYGLYLTFCSALCPLQCLPSYLPLGSLASYLGTQYHLAMSILAQCDNRCAWLEWLPDCMCWRPS